MPPAVSDRLVRMLNRRAPDLRELSISWFGGEPLLALSVIDKIMTAAGEACRAHGATLHSGATTNGHLLTEPVFERLSELGLTHYQITLDGPEQFHNERRRLANGPGQFATIRGNLLRMCESKRDFVIALQIHVDRRNASSIDSLFDELGPIARDSRVRIEFERIKNLGKAPPASIEMMPLPEFEEFVRDKLARHAGSGIDLVNVNDKAEEHICYAALPNNFVVRADGRIQMCTVALGAEQNSVGRLTEDGGIALNDAYSKWLAGWHSNDRAALGCPAKAILSAPREAQPALQAQSA